MWEIGTSTESVFWSPGCPQQVAASNLAYLSLNQNQLPRELEHQERERQGHQHQHLYNTGTQVAFNSRARCNLCGLGRRSRMAGEPRASIITSCKRYEMRARCPGRANGEMSTTNYPLPMLTRPKVCNMVSNPRIELCFRQSNIRSWRYTLD